MSKNMFYQEIDAQDDPDFQRAMAASLLLSEATSTSSVQAISSRPSAASNDSARRLVSDESKLPRKKRKLDRQQINEMLAEEVKILKEEKAWKAEHPVEIPLTYAGGALRLTRTPGRSAVNTVSLKDLIYSYELCSAFVFSFCIENDHLFQYFPFRTEKGWGRPHCSIFVGRDFSLDMVGMRFANLDTLPPSSSAEWNRAVEIAHDKYSELYGRNFRAFYPHMSRGCAHSKLMILIYPEFLRLVITSANLMELDVVHGDNHWFIQDFPRLSDNAAETYTETKFEQELIQHLEDLECPDEFLDRQLRAPVFDFSAAKVYIVSSKPGSYSGDEASKYGQLRLRRIVRNKILKYYTEAPRMTFEVCVGSVGVLEVEDMVKNLLESCAGGRQVSEEGRPALKMIFPTYADVQRSNIKKVSNIGCHIEWKKLEENLAEYLRDIFYHYTSKDAGCMFHLKSILGLRADAPPAAPPLYMYVGSHNFSAAAWGTVLPALLDHGGGATLQGVANLECGIVVKGGDIAGMLETADWQDIVPYVRPSEANKYKKGERPYNAPPGSVL
ncbi:tyrosyl-DNA phosphodiesterase-domain-containing protein [Mycena latifolia]|nr:tyrosyl-DNA phosphodiesterase-domain-containing protein [Mycena latifolia]